MTDETAPATHDDAPTWVADTTAFAARATQRRIELGLTRERLAELLGVSVPTLEAIEGGQSPSTYLRIWMSDILGIDDVRPDGDAVAELDRCAAALGCWTGHAPLLDWARRLYSLDTQITRLAAPGFLFGGSPQRIAAAAALPGPVFAPLDVPELESPERRPAETRKWLREHGASIDYGADGLVLAALVRTRFALPQDEPVDPAALAALLGVGVAAAPAQRDSWTKGLLLRLASTALVVTNSRLNPVVGRHSVAHLLGHLVAGDVVGTAIIDTVADQDDDSIYCCAGAGPDTCRRADAFAAELLVPAAMLAVSGTWPGRTARTSGQRLELLVRLVKRLADDLSVPVYVVVDQAGRAKLLGRDEQATLHQLLARRAPFGGRARDGARDAVHHEDFALPAGDGKRRMPAALRARALASWDSGISAWPAFELLDDAGFTAAERARFLEQVAARSADSDD